MPESEWILDWPRLKQWLLNERPSEDDLIGNRRVARRLAEYLKVHGGTVGLVGPFGSGKTSVVSWLKEEVKRVSTEPKIEVWFAEQSCWGFEDSSSAIQQILAKAISEVGLHADCFSLRSLPEAYRKTFSAGGDWLRTLSDLVFGSTDPLEQFQQLSDVLEAVDARLVLVIEDLDRTTSSRFDRQEMLALLQRLRATSRLSFVLATGLASARDIDFAKLCDHIEIMPEFGAEPISTMIEAVRGHCLDQFPHIRTAADKTPWRATTRLLLRKHDYIFPSDGAICLLRTPRALKHALRRTYQAWEVLHGEVDLDHLLGVNILRSGAPEAFDFLLRHWGDIQDDPSTSQFNRDGITQFRERIIGEWRRVTADVEWDVRAASAIIRFLIPSAGEYLGEQRGSGVKRLQGIGHGRYWRRVVNEEIGPGEVRDQKVLKDIADWQTSPTAEAPLIAGLRQGGDYVEMWEHFAPSSFCYKQRLILQLAEQLLTYFRTPRGVRVRLDKTNIDPDYPEDWFVAVWRCANRKVPKDIFSRNWLESQVRLAMGSSLSLVNDLYSYYASIQNGVLLNEETRSYIRGGIHTLAQEQLRSGEDLLRVIHPDLAHDVYELVFPSDVERPPSAFRGVEHWDWLGPVLLNTLKTNPAKVALKVGILILSDRRGEQPGIVIYEIDRSLLTRFFGEDSDEVIRLLASASENFNGRDREFLEELVQSANVPPESKESQSEDDAVSI